MFIDTNTIMIIATLLLMFAAAFVDLLCKYLDCKSALKRARPILKDSVVYQRIFYKYYNSQNKIPFLVHDGIPYLPFDKVKYKQSEDEDEREGIMMLKIVEKGPVLYVQDFYEDKDKIDLSDLNDLRFVKSGFEVKRK